MTFAIHIGINYNNATWSAAANSNRMESLNHQSKTAKVHESQLC